MKELPRRMLSAASFEYGDYTKIKIIERPLPEIDDASFLVEVKASAITTADSMMRRGIPRFARLFMGLRKPKNHYIGTGFSGIVVAVGKGVDGIKCGDEVFGETGLEFSANSQFVKIHRDGVYLKKPEFLSHQQACVLCDGALTSYSFLKALVSISSDHKIFINGGSGSLGLMAIQIAKHCGAYVTTSCSSYNSSHLLGMGADETIDYRSLDEHTNKYDLVFDCVGRLEPSMIRHLLISGGCYLTPVLQLSGIIQALKSKIGLGGYSYRFAAIGLSKPDELKLRLTEILDLIRSGSLEVSVEQSFSFANLSEAHKQIEMNQKNGHFVLISSE